VPRVEIKALLKIPELNTLNCMCLSKKKNFSLKENQVEDIGSFTLHWCICFWGKKKKRGDESKPALNHHS
jgi:hypothetical protein